MITITGHSDDIISIGGDVNEEFSAYLDNEDKRYVIASDGSVFSVRYDRDGLWRISLFSRGSCDFTKVEGSVDRDSDDVVTIHGDVSWVAFASEIARRA